MLTLTHGDLLSADVEALVNTVNTVGVMGKGIALQFKKKYPGNFEAYRKVCKNQELQPGRVHSFATNALQNPRYIINFPTKRHWRGRSKLEDIRDGLRALTEEIRRLGIRSIAVPPLGCGNGGLEWGDVLPMIHEAFDDLPEVEALVYEPAGAPPAEMMATNTSPPKMTPGRAVLLGLMKRYLVPGYDYRLSLLEIQKLAYFMQLAGQRLRLEFQRGPYGPYADNLRHVLNRIEGHFIVGYGDGRNSPETPIHPLPEAMEHAEAYLLESEDVKDRFDRVTELIVGFETPYGMELLSSVHWVASKINVSARTDVEAAIRGVHNWSDRKRELLNADHVRLAWQRLHEMGWL